MNKNLLNIFYTAMVVVLLGTVSLKAAESPSVQRISGEIGWLDMVLGKLELHQIILFKSC